MSNNLPNVVDKKAIEEALRKTTNVVPIALITESIDIINTIGNAYIEGRKADVEIERIHSKRDVLLEDIKQRYNLYHQIFTRIFDERRDVISKNFEIIEKGIKENKDNLISLGLENLSRVVTSSPFMAFSDFQQQLLSGEPFEL